MFLTFNELSAEKTKLKSHSEAREIINKLVLFCKSLQENKILDECVFPETLFSIELCEGYGITQWLNDGAVRVEQKQFLKRFLDKNRRYYNQSSVVGDFKIILDDDAHCAVGCAFALEHQYTVLSLDTHPFWEKREIKGEYIYLGLEEVLQYSACAVDNFWTGLSNEEICHAYQKELADGITSGQDLWEKREILYPNLIFCENVRSQLYEDSEKYHIAAVMKRLKSFQEYFANCGSVYDPKALGMDSRTESATVKSDPKLKEYRQFRMPNGREAYFFDHVGFTGKYAGGRIHFLPDNPNKRCYIGYIGRHLPTKNF